MAEIELLPKRTQNPDLKEVQEEQSRILTLDEVSIKDEIEESKGTDNFVWEAMRNSYDPLTNTVRDVTFDDRDLKRAVNYYDFCKNVADKSFKLPFARQLWMSFVLFGEYCPVCTKPYWYESVENIEVDMDPNDLAKKVVMLKNGVCPKCQSTKANFILENKMVGYNQLVLVAGQRAGKSTHSTTISGYHMHSLLKSPKLSSVCQGIQDFTPLSSTFVALTAARAIKLLWNPFHHLVTNTNWFKEYFKLLDHVGQQYGKELYKKNDTFFRFFHKNLDYYSMGPNMRTLRGDTRVLAATDELGMFPIDIKKTAVTNNEDEEELDDEENERERANADEVHQSLDNSLSTVRTEMYSLYKRNISTIPTGLNIAISSPKSWKDKICRLYLESSDPEALSLGIRLPTWGINPLYTRDHPIIKQAYNRSAIKAERDFGANPPKVETVTFAKKDVRICFVGQQHHAISVNIDDEEFTSGVVKTLIEKSVWKPSVLSLDAGLTNNSFALSLGVRKETSVEILSVLELVPSSKKPVNFPKIYQSIILPLIQQTNVGVLVADRWNSIHLLQQAAIDTEKKVLPIQISMTPRYFAYFKNLITTGNLIVPETANKFENIEEVQNFKSDLAGFPADHLYLQMMTTVDQDGILVKGSGYTDDILRSVAVNCTALFMPKVMTHLEKMVDSNRNVISNKSRVIVAGRSRFR